jgi:hypothetical protein
MRVKVLKDSTLIVKAGQVVDIDERNLRFLLGRVEPVTEPAKETAPESKKKTAKKSGK